MSGFRCPLCGSTAWSSRTIEDGSVARDCAGGCGYTWHYREDHLHGVEHPELVVDNAPELHAYRSASDRGDPS